MGFIVQVAAKTGAETETTVCLARIKASELDSKRVGANGAIQLGIAGA